MSLTPFESNLIADVGISMGDEGKGRLVYEIIEELKQQTGKDDPARVVIKVNGGANSGHTAGGLKLNLLPAGVIEASVRHLAIGCGVVADPRKFHWEARPLEQKGYGIYDRLIIDERTLVSDLTHRLLDLAWEDYRQSILGEDPRGSTGRGITPSYLDEVGQMQIYYMDFQDTRAHFAAKLEKRIARTLKTIEHVCEVKPERWDAFFSTLTQAETRANSAAVQSDVFEASEFDFSRFKGDEPFTLKVEELTEAYWKAGRALINNIGDVRELVLQTIDKGYYVIGEFGQAYWLDKRHGFPPNVTASHTFTPEFFQSAGIPAQPVHTMGCAKAYDTKVGTHVFLTEMPEAHPLARKLKTLEFGATTGRQRMVGWFDAVEKGDALRFGGYQDLVINKLDALSYSDTWQGGELLVCVAYQDTSGKRYYEVPRNDLIRTQLKPVYKQLPGWSEDISKVRRFAQLPDEAKRYIGVLYKSIVDVANRCAAEPTRLPNLRYIGVGPDPSQIIKDVPSSAELLALGK